MTVLERFAWGHTPHSVIRAALAADPAYAAGYKLVLRRAETITLLEATRAVICTDGKYTHRGKWTVNVAADTFVQLLDDLLQVAFKEVHKTSEFGSAAVLYTKLLATLNLKED